MSKTLKLILALALCTVMMTGAALADAISFDGTVTPASTVEVYAPLGGMVERVNVKAGQTVTADDEILSLRTTKVYAAENGTVSVVYGQPGEAAADINARYGAVMYVESTVKYTVSASLSNAYDSIETTFVTPGQTVYLVGRNNTAHRGEGKVTILDGSSYTVEVTSGEFVVGESVNVYMQETCRDNQRMGRGNVARMAPAAVTVETGTIVNIPVKAGSRVRRGDLLLETLEGTARTASSSISAGVDGVVASVSAAQGTAVAQDAVVAVIYPADAMQIEGLVSESDLSSVRVGSPVSISLVWNEDSEVTYPGVISGISALADETAEETSYMVSVAFTPDENTRYGMNALVTVVEEAK